MHSPTERVMMLSSQGLSEPEIIQILRQEGYTPIQVDNAMKEALRGMATGAPPRMQPPRQEQSYAPAPSMEYGPQPRRPPAPRPYSQPAYEEEPGFPGPPSYPQAPRPRNLEPPVDFEEFKNANKDIGLPELPDLDDKDDDLDMPSARPPRERSFDIPAMPEEDMPEDEEDMAMPIPRIAPKARDDIRTEKRRALEELTESVVEEKWDDFTKRIEGMNGRFQQLNDRIAALEQRIGQMQGDKKSDLMEIEGKIDGYKQSIDEIGSRMESVERAMKDSLNPMMQTLRSLSETIKSLKEKR